MKLSRNFLNDYVDTSDIAINKLAEDMTSIGNEYEKVILHCLDITDMWDEYLRRQ